MSDEMRLESRRISTFSSKGSVKGRIRYFGPVYVALYNMILHQSIEFDKTLSTFQRG